MEIKISSSKRDEIIDVTHEVEELVEEEFSKKTKACLIYVGHTTCGILIQENYDPDVNSDIIEYLNKIPKEGWRHKEGNTDSHIKAALIGPSKVIPVENNKLKLGRWQGISLCEFDGPKERTINILEI